ncbi:MAG: RnfH family protein [Burkholderiales bacterium]
MASVDAREARQARDNATGLVNVELAYSPAPRVVDLRSLRVPAGSSVLQAVRQSRLLEQHREIDPAVAEVGLWGRRVGWHEALREGDRIEIYRPLRVDPKEARRQRYRAQGERGRRRPGVAAAPKP